MLFSYGESIDKRFLLKASSEHFLFEIVNHKPILMQHSILHCSADLATEIKT